MVTSVAVRKQTNTSIRYPKTNISDVSQRVAGRRTRLTDAYAARLRVYGRGLGPPSCLLRQVVLGPAA
jgi:hypothetical protein